MEEKKAQVVEKGANIEDVISKSELYIEEHKNTILIVVIVVVVAILAFFGMRKFYFQPRQVKANEAVYAAEQWYQQSDFQQALEGNEQYDGFIDVAKRFGSTKAGKRAKYCAGICYLQLGQYEEAASYLKSYKGKDIFTPILATIAEGDAQLDMGNTHAALGLYEKAAKMDDNYITAPFSLFKAGMVNVIEGNGKKALECFTSIKKKYPESTEWRDIDKYIAWAESM